ncbi:hypothetical protein K1X12_10020 [Hyphomonas sp. WL0036]|uniref:hypothetical protein n=1 Tax=Hyphomonas sediminis TaxID=2866160 RepID=UPI001C807989|nr:hypothetical protein [Hyphomonas sediminis]MBY9067236.1 hypothetical protein [Hyphomonas sediminis]
MTRRKPLFAAGLACFLLAAPSAAQGADTGVVLTPPDQLFGPKLNAFQKTYNDASTCSGAAAQLRSNAAVFAARALNETTAARRRGDEEAAGFYNLLFQNAVTMRDSAATATNSLDDLREALARRPEVNDAGGRILYLSGARSISPLALDSLATDGQALQDGMFHRGNILLADLGDVRACLEDVTSDKLPIP